MQIREVQNLIYDVCGKNIPTFFIDSRLKNWNFLSGFPAWTSPKNEIIINTIVWNECDDLTQKYIVLHEVGHIEDPSNYHSSMIQRELFAQVYAIDKARSLGLYELSEFMTYILSQWEFDYKWNSPQRKYILASKLAKKKGIVS